MCYVFLIQRLPQCIKQSSLLGLIVEGGVRWFRKAMAIAKSAFKKNFFISDTIVIPFYVYTVGFINIYHGFVYAMFYSIYYKVKVNVKLKNNNTLYILYYTV